MILLNSIGYRYGKDWGLARRNSMIPSYYHCIIKRWPAEFDKTQTRLAKLDCTDAGMLEVLVAMLLCLTRLQVVLPWCYKLACGPCSVLLPLLSLTKGSKGPNKHVISTASKLNNKILRTFAFWDFGHLQRSLPRTITRNREPEINELLQLHCTFSWCRHRTTVGWLAD